MTDAKRPLRVALYARYSTDMQNPLSVEDQFRIAERYAQQQGWEVVERFSDDAVSGAVSRDRPGFQRLSADLARGKFDVVLAESVDRISRDPEHMAGFYKNALFNRVELHITGRGKMDAMTLNILSMFAAVFLEELAQKTRRGLEGRAQKGLSAGGKVYGYKQCKDERGVPVKGARDIDEVEAAVVRGIFRDYAAGQSPIAIANRLNDEGIPSPSAETGRRSSGRWKQNTINGNRERGTGILNNELYIGRQVWNRLTYMKHPQTERRVSQLNPENKWVISEVPELRIIDQELWDEVKARQDAQRKRVGKAEAKDRNKLSIGQSLRRRKYVLSGLLHCGLCGGKMTVAGSSKYRTYYCANAKEMGPSVCTGFRGLRETVALPLVLSGLRTELMKPAAYDRFRERFKAKLADSQEAAVDRLRVHDARQRELETRQSNLVRVIEAKADVPDVLLARLTAVSAELQQMQGKRADLVVPEVELPEDLPELYRAMVADLATALSDESVAGRAADELHELVDRVVVHWDEEARGHWLSIEGSLLEMLRKSAPSKLDAMRGDIFAEVGCGSRI
ncbi:recombinase family protein [Limimaricola variabilis]